MPGPAWRGALLRLGIVWLALLALFSSDWGRIAGQWWNSSTYNHMMLVPVMVGWLVWQRSNAISMLQPSTWWPGLVVATVVLIVWTLGALTGFDLLRQAAVVALLPTTLLVMMGPRVFAGLLFPLGYMAFMVPFGDELVPLLQMVTATLTVALVKLSAIPAAIDGVFIETPAGLFEVAEACSGVKFLIAMIALGVFAAHVCFTSWRRRAAFMALCIATPILGNAIRAYSTILAAQYVGAERAGGIDHLIYGWVFFGAIIASVLWVSWRWFDRAADDPMIDIPAILRSLTLARLEQASTSPITGLIGLFILLASALLWARAADGRAAILPDRIKLPAVAGWQRSDYVPAFAWEPRATGAEHRLLGRYVNATGAQVDVFYALYSVQRENKEAGGFGEGALRAESGWSWLGSGDKHANARSDRLRAENGTERLAVTFYRTGYLLTGSNAALKLAALRDRALLRDQPTALLILSSEARSERDPANDVAAFSDAIGPIDQWMDRIGAGR
ncbi:exosortase A [Novosphingobium sp.]|uniref:exosortase A n=1 Tax=Novosphingobium sp. TaxID=1874826 RepID=UPI0025F4BFA7|nr:exosortase A [Novosphingobium sp.]